jgi:F-type H+-transporting ATPase subunit b
MFLFAELGDQNFLNVLFDFKSNLLNWLLLVALLGWLYAKYVPPILTARKEAIDSELKAAANAKEAAAKALDEQKEKVAKADLEAERIMVEAKEEAEQLRKHIEGQADKDLTELLKKFESQAAMERRLAISQMREIAVKTALKLAQENMTRAMNEERRGKLLNQFIEQLDMIDGNLQNSEQLKRADEGRALSASSAE